MGIAGPPSTCSNAAPVVTLSGQSSAALSTEDERDRLLAIASAILLFCTPQPSELAALAGTERVAEGGLAGRRRGADGRQTITIRARAHVDPPLGSFGSGLTRLAVPRSGNTGRPQRARSTRQSTAKGQARSGRDRAGLARDADGSRRWATALLNRHLQRPDRHPRFPATTPEGLRPPNADPSAVSPSRAGSGGPLLCLRRNLWGGLR